MVKQENWPLWVRIYASRKKKNFITQLLGASLGVVVLMAIDYLSAGRELSSILNADQIMKYLTILAVFIFYVVMQDRATVWVEKNSSGDRENQYLSQWYAFLVGLVMIVIGVLLRQLV